MRIWLTLLAVALYFITAFIFIGTGLYRRISIYNIYAQHDGIDSIVIKYHAYLGSATRNPGIIVKETKDYIVFGFVECAIHQKCFFDVKNEREKNNQWHDMVKIKNKYNKPIKVRYVYPDRIEQIWP